MDNRFVLTYGVVHYTYEAEEGDPPSHIVVCVSAGNNPLADWTCWALDARVMVVAPNGYLCDGMGKGSFIADSPTVSAPCAAAAMYSHLRRSQRCRVLHSLHSALICHGASMYSTTALWVLLVSVRVGCCSRGSQAARLRLQANW